MTTTRNFRAATPALVLAGVVLAFSPAPRAAAQNNGNVTNAVEAKLNKPQFKNVAVTVGPHGTATLTGTVALAEFKEDADRIVHRVKGVKAVDNEIRVGGKPVSDAEIMKKLGPQIAYSRTGWGGLVFDAILVHVQNGVVTLSGHVKDYPDRDAAVGLAASTPGVQQVIDNIQVDPPSPMDWQIRMQMARAIYGYPPLNKYAINPVRPIRITVQNGHVELYGTVDSAQDRQLVMARASTVPGVFDIKDYIQVGTQGNNEKQQVQAPKQ